MLRIAEAVELTDTGRQREANEDSLFVRAPLFAVADGMGGAQAGEVASQLAVEAFADAAASPDSGSAAPEELLRLTVQDANRRIFEHAQGDASRSGMGTTLTAALVRGEEISFGHVGDSRAYVLRDGELKQITDDHSLVEELRRQGRLTRDQAADHPQRSVITRALGPDPDVEVDTMTFRGRPGDVYLLCSDGLTTMLSDDELLAVLRRGGDLERTARRLVKAANDRGGRDNITVVMFRLEGAGEGAAVEEGETLVGPRAEEAGLSAAAVRAAAGREPARTPPPRRHHATPAGAAETAGGRRWPRRILRGVVALVIVGALAYGALLGARQIWFLGVDSEGQVAVYRGLPYDLPLGLELYSKQDATGIELSALPEERRGVATNHDLRSEDDARSLAADLQVAAASRATAGDGSGGGPGDTKVSPGDAVPKPGDAGNGSGSGKTNGSGPSSGSSG